MCEKCRELYKSIEGKEQLDAALGMVIEQNIARHTEATYSGTDSMVIAVASLMFIHKKIDDFLKTNGVDQFIGTSIKSFDEILALGKAKFDKELKEYQEIPAINSFSNTKIQA